MSKWPVGEGARQLGLHHAPLVVLGLEVRVWELDRCRPKGRAWHGAAGRGMARAWRSRVRASKLPYAIVIRACALAECLQVAVGVAREGVGEEEERDEEMADESARERTRVRMWAQCLLVARRRSWLRPT